jgi:hypothetical protein
MSEITERLKGAIADRDVIARAGPALKGGLGTARRALKDAGCLQGRWRPAGPRRAGVLAPELREGKV